MIRKKDVFINYVKNGGKSICSPQIGAGAGFDTKLAGKKWISETSVQDTLAAVEKFDMVPLINVGLCDLGICNPELMWKESFFSREENKIYREKTLKTPVGMLQVKSVEVVYNSPLNVKYALQGEDDLDAFEWYLDAAMESDFSKVTSYVCNIVRQVEGRAALSVQWAMQPYEMLCFPNTVDTVLLAIDCPDRFMRLMDKIVKLDFKLIDAVARGGADFVFLGGPGSEMISPAFYENYIVPYSKIVTAAARDAGLLIYTHICSPIEPMLSLGYYNQMGIDLFETLSSPPVGNIVSLEDALSKINPDICTRGNLGLDLLLNANEKIVKQEAIRILEATNSRKHILAASDYLFYQISEKNIHAMCEAIKEYYS